MGTKHVGLNSLQLSTQGAWNEALKEHGKEHSWSMEHGALHETSCSFFMNNLNASQASYTFYNYIQLGAGGISL